MFYYYQCSPIQSSLTTINYQRQFFRGRNEWMGVFICFYCITMGEQAQEIDLVFEGLGLSGSIYISNYQAATNPKTLAKLGIRAVMTTARGLLLPYSKEQLPNYLYLPVDDTPEQQLGKFLGPAFDFIEKNRARTNVLVHCYSGISRSAAFIIAYLMRKYGYAFNQSHLLIKRRKRRIKPNPSFIRQLEKYQLELQGQRSNNQITRIQVGNQADCEKKMQLVIELNSIKAGNLNLQAKISEAREKILDSERKRRPSSEYLKQRLMEKSTNSSRTSKAGSIYGDTPRKGQLNLEMLKGALSVIRSSVS